MLSQKAGRMTKDERDFFVLLGKRIAGLRKERGLTQTELAQQLQVSQQTIDSYEKGRRRVPVSALPDVARALDTSIEEIIGGSGRPQAAKRGPVSRLQRQIEEIQRLPRSKQRFVSEMLETVIAQARRAEAS